MFMTYYVQKKKKQVTKQYVEFDLIFIFKKGIEREKENRLIE